jgi:hypothetical protein
MAHTNENDKYWFYHKCETIITVNRCVFVHTFILSRFVSCNRDANSKLRPSRKTDSRIKSNHRREGEERNLTQTLSRRRLPIIVSNSGTINKRGRRRRRRRRNYTMKEIRQDREFAVQSMSISRNGDPMSDRFRIMQSM